MLRRLSPASTACARPRSTARCCGQPARARRPHRAITPTSSRPNAPLQKPGCCGPAAAATAPAAAAQETVPPGSGSSGTLQDLLAWLVANGVTGVGSEDSAVALYEDAEGDRGVIAVQDIAAGSSLLHVPLRLAITDVLDDSQRERLVGQGALWQDRLVAKLLQEVQRGAESPWYPYLQALPRCVPSALEQFSHAEALECQLPHVTRAIVGHADRMAASWASCRPDAIGGADLTAYRWAHSIVMSRTFGNASPHGGVGVRMCVPLIDLLNHGGDEAPGGLLAAPPVATDNVRWDVVSPENAANVSGGWEMVLTCTQAIAAGLPLLLSYREGPNEEWLLHYGFVPPANPHDTITLFPSLSAALQHLYDQQLSQGKAAAELAPLFAAAHEVGLEALQQEVAAAAAGSDMSSWGSLLETLEPIQVASGSRVSGPLIAALEVLRTGDMAAVEATVAGLAWQQLRALPSSLLADLAALVADGWQAGDEQQAELYGGLLRHYAQALVPAYEPGMEQHLQAAAAAAAAADGTAAGSVMPAAGGSLPRKHKRAVPGPSQPPSQQPQPQQQPCAVDIAVLSLQALVAAVQAHEQAHQQPAAAAPAAAGPASSAAGAYSEGCRPGPLRLALKFRAQKKQLLADVVLAARVPLQQLERQRELLASFQASAAAAGRRGSANSADDGAQLPWERGVS